MLTADFVTTEDGTGVVHTAIAFGEDDFRLGEQYGIKVQNLVRPDGTFDERIEPFAGRFVKDADPDIVEALRVSGRLFRAEGLPARLPPLLALRNSAPLLREDELVRPHHGGARPAPGRQRGGHLVLPPRQARPLRQLAGEQRWTGRSRQGHWGTPLPIWRCEEGHVFCAGSVGDLAERGGQVPADLYRPFIDDVWP